MLSGIAKLFQRVLYLGCRRALSASVTMRRSRRPLLLVNRTVRGKAVGLCSAANADDEHEDKGEREGRQDRDPLHGFISLLRGTSVRLLQPTKGSTPRGTAKLARRQQAKAEPHRTRLPLPAWVCSPPVVSKRTSPVPTKLFRWRVIRLRGSPAMWVGDVDAPDEPSAIEEAIKIYNITDREHQRRLAVRRIK
jgi:hypothetical protein